ncbi:octanoyltransferase LIP2p2, chloroplastic [Triticum aestivum]|uniref:octanoyltransferase LIP2p2, chloroplastic n=1 Tax=Triticum aestivum TaxID=4565 RepID=UPI001D009BBC|nr:octanoyltransferase LIP2p2, chloroplastic-like [Triticum aestivum]
MLPRKVSVGELLPENRPFVPWSRVPDGAPYLRLACDCPRSPRLPCDRAHPSFPGLPRDTTTAASRATVSPASQVYRPPPPAAPASPPSTATSSQPSTSSPSRIDRTRCELFDLHQQIVPLVDSWGWQKSIVERRKPLVGIDTDTDEDHSDTLIALQHPPVYTLGNGSSEKYLNFNIEDSPIESHRIDRAGEVTYHGPGQLVLYPILNLRYQKKDLNWYQRSLETVVNRALQSAFSIKASTIEGLTGVWVGMLLSIWIPQNVLPCYHVSFLTCTPSVPIYSSWF